MAHYDRAASEVAAAAYVGWVGPEFNCRDPFRVCLCGTA